VRTKFFAISVCFFLLLTVVSVVPTHGAEAVDEGEWITEYTVKDSTSKLLLKVKFEAGEPVINETYSPILAGSELTVTFTINIFAGGSGKLQLSTDMQHSSLHTTFWQSDSLNYSFSNPNAATTTFDWTKGTLDVVCYGKIPASAVKKTPVQFTLVKLSVPGGDILDQIKPYIYTAEMGNYASLLQAKQEKLQSLKDSGVSAGYIELFENVIEQAQAEAAEGYVDNAVALLNALDVSSEPASAVMEFLFLPIIVVVAVLAVVLGFLFLRTKGKIKYVLLVLEDQIKDLEGLTLRASKIDRTLSSSLDSIKDRLKSLVGM
jgi:hypothetical protein